MGVGPASPIAPGDVTSRRCLNCGAELHGAYCAACGQREVVDPNPSFRHLLQELFEEITSLDGKILQTFRVLLAKPGELSTAFFSGRRTRYVTPLRLYFLCSLILFVGMPVTRRLTGHGDASGLKAKVTENTSGVRITTGKDTVSITTPRADSGATTGLPRGALAQWIERRAPEWQRRSQRADFSSNVMQLLPKVVFALLPVAALVLWVVYWPRRMKYPRHLYVAVHMHAAFYFLLAVSQLTALLPVGKLSSVASVAIALYLIWYVLAALRHVYGGSWKGTFARLSVIGVLYSVVLMFAFLGSLVLAVVSA